MHVGTKKHFLGYRSYISTWYMFQPPVKHRVCDIFIAVQLYEQMYTCQALSTMQGEVPHIWKGITLDSNPHAILHTIHKAMFTNPIHFVPCMYLSCILYYAILMILNCLAFFGWWLILLCSLIFRGTKLSIIATFCDFLLLLGNCNKF